MGVFLAAQNAMDQLWDVPSSAGLTPCATARPRSFSLMIEQPATRADKRALTQRGKIEERRQDET